MGLMPRLSSGSGIFYFMEWASLARVGTRSIGLPTAAQRLEQGSGIFAQLRVAHRHLLARLEHVGLRIQQRILRDEAGAILRLDRFGGLFAIGERLFERGIAPLLGIDLRQRILDVAQRAKHGL